MTKRRWRELKRQREIEALRVREIEELERRRLVGIKSIPAVGNDGNVPAVRTVFIPTGAVSSRASLNLNKCEFNHAKG